MTSDGSLDMTSKKSFAYKEENNIAKNCTGRSVWTAYEVCR